MLRTVNLKAWLKKTKTTQAQFGALLDPPVTAGMVGHWVNGRHEVVAERVLEIEAKTGTLVTRHELRPDLYPKGLAA